MSEVILVQMPYSAVCRPSLALSLLKAYLSEAGIPCEVTYGNLRFAQEVGLDLYRFVEDSSTTDLLGEWTFAEAAFPGFQPDHDLYLQLIGRSLGSDFAQLLREIHPGLDLRRVVTLIRARAVSFVDRLAHEVVARRPRIVGCSSMFQQHCASLALLRRIKELAPDVVTLLGGANCEADMGHQTHVSFPWVDFVVSGEADAYFADLCRHILERAGAPAFEALPVGVWGPAHRRNEAAALPSARAVIAEMDATAVPDFDDYFRALESSPIAPYVSPGLPVETSRGCWWGMKHHCTFCGLNGAGMSFRSKSPARVLEEFRTLTHKHGIRRLGVVDNILDMSYLRTVFPSLTGADSAYSLFYEVKPNLRREQVELLARAGLRWMQPGIESMHGEMLALLRKGNSALMNVQLLQWAHEEGVRISWNSLFGAPGEKEEWFHEMASWLPAISHLQPPAGSCPIHFDRFSPYEKDAAAFGLDLAPVRQYAFVYPLGSAELARLAYFFYDRGQENSGGRRPVGARQLASVIALWRRRFWSDERPRLQIESEAPTSMVIVDSRGGGPAERVALEGLACAIVRACEAPTTPARLKERLGADAEVELVAADLLERRLLLSLEGKLLALPVRAPKRALPSLDDAPTGIVRDADIVRDFSPGSLARACLTSVRDRPLAELWGSTVVSAGTR